VLPRGNPVVEISDAESGVRCRAVERTYVSEHRT
jgi:hypothetical protein